MKSKTTVIGLSGGSGSGKTSIIKALRRLFTEKELCIISQDDYYRPRKLQKKDKHGITNFDLPESIDDKAFFMDIMRLTQGKKVKRKEYTFNNEKKKSKTLIFKPAPVLLVEGLFVFHFQPILDLLKVKIFIHAKDNLKIIRRIKRDRVERNYPIEDVLYRYEHHVHPTYERYIAPFQDEADIVINNNQSFQIGLSFIESYIKEMLEKYD